MHHSPGNSLALQGLRGGVGTTSLLAGLGYALHQLDQRVLLVDLCPENLLRLHFRFEFSSPSGWARAELDGEPWHGAACQVLPGLHVLPYGRTTEAEHQRIEHSLQQAPKRWVQRRQHLERRYDWVLFDLPQRLPGHTRPLLGPDGCSLQCTVLNVDPSCYALLLPALGEPHPRRWLLVNRFDPTHPLESDLLQMWRDRYESLLVSQLVHEDGAMRDALTHKLPVGHQAPHSQAAKELGSLAVWCMVRGTRQDEAGAA